VEAKPAEVPFLQRMYVFVPGKAEDMDGWFLVDSGASLGAMPDPIFDALDAKRPRAALEGFYTPAAIGTFWARLATVATYEVGGKSVSRMLVRTMPDGLIPLPTKGFAGKPFLGVLPSGFMSHFMVTVDYAHKLLRLDAAKGAKLADTNLVYTSGIGLDDGTTDPPVKVSHVLPKSSAEEAGVLPGDEIVSIDGSSAATMDPYARPWRLVGEPPSQTIKLKIARGQATMELSVETRDLLLPPP
jgi:membrane-associated protease RseP (regulator of RpoE activity)